MDKFLLAITRQTTQIRYNISPDINEKLADNPLKEFL